VLVHILQFAPGISPGGVKSACCRSDTGGTAAHEEYSRADIPRALLASPSRDFDPLPFACYLTVALDGAMMNSWAKARGLLKIERVEKL